MTYRMREWLRSALLACCMLAAAGVQSGVAQEGAPQEVKERILQLMREAEELKRAGRGDAAERLMAEAAELRARVERRLGGEETHRQRMLAQIQGAVAALRELGRPDAADQLQRTLESLVRAESETERPEPGEHPEIREARRQLEVVHIAMEALASAGQGEAAHQLERVAHAFQRVIGGLRGEDARAALLAAPGRREQAELLALASNVLRDRGQVDRARAVGELAERLASREAPPREEVEPEERERAEEGGDAERDERLEVLEERLRDVTSALEQLHAELRELRRDR